MTDPHDTVEESETTRADRLREAVSNEPDVEKFDELYWVDDRREVSASDLPDSGLIVTKDQEVGKTFVWDHSVEKWTEMILGADLDE